jgi:hypothetical protein
MADYLVSVQVLVAADAADAAEQQIFDALDAHWSVLAIETEAA